jgi:hypothetical protein
MKNHANDDDDDDDEREWMIFLNGISHQFQKEKPYR